MDENEFEFNGVAFAAVYGLNCRDCAMWNVDECACNTVSKREFVFPACNSSQRKDGRDVIFVEKQK